MSTVNITIRNQNYVVDAAELRAAEIAFDLWRDGIGQFKGDLGRQLLLRATSDICHRVAAHDPFDPYKPKRLTKALRSILAKRPRSGGTDARSSSETPRGKPAV